VTLSLGGTVVELLAVKVSRTVIPKKEEDKKAQQWLA